ncbi:TPA: glycosyltransferase family 4 protein [Pseudomonas putida]
MKVAVDASRNRSGGAKAHLIGILKDGDPTAWGIDEVHVWSYQALLDALPERPWLVKHSDPSLEKGLVAQLLWQRFELPKALKRAGIDALLSTDAGTVCRYTPSVVMSRDMLSFEPGEMDRFKWSAAWLRLFLLRYMQVWSLRAATGQLYLTDYAAKVISRFVGRTDNVRVIPHGVSDRFRMEPKTAEAAADGVINCVCVSNADLYKHQWNVIEAIANLRREGYNLKLTLLGAGDGRPGAVEMIRHAIERHDPQGQFVVLNGAVAHADIPAFLHGSDVFVFSSSCENMPNTLVEGMSAGLPIACSNRGPMPEILKDGGVYFDPENTASIEAALRELLVSDDARSRLAGKSHEYAQAFSWARCAKETWAYLAHVSDVAKKN